MHYGEFSISGMIWVQILFAVLNSYMVKKAGKVSGFRLVSIGEDEILDWCYVLIPPRSILY